MSMNCHQYTWHVYTCSLALFTGAGPESHRLKSMNLHCFPPKLASLHALDPQHSQKCCTKSHQKVRLAHVIVKGP